MIRLLIVMTHPEPIRSQYADRIRAAFPQIQLDVVDHRSKADPFWSLPNVIVTPHLGGVFDEYPSRAWPIIEQNIRRFLAGDAASLINRVDH